MLKYFFLCCIYFYCPNINAQQNLNSKAINNIKSSVPAPWTPLQITQNNQTTLVNCWGREYVFNNSFLPSQIYSQGEPLLSNPINLIINYNGKNLQLNSPSIELNFKSDESIDLTSTLKIKAYQFGAVVITAKIHIEYDGMMLITLNTNYPVGFKPNFISLEVPYNTKVSKYYLKCPAYSNEKYSDELLLNNGLLLQTGFTPYMWIGDDYRGLFWFCESAQNWPNAKQQNAIQIIRQDDKLIQKFDLTAINTYQFGVQATPVKPLPANWRSLRFSPAINSNIIIPWPKPGDSSSTKYFGWPEAVNDNKYNTLINYYHKKKQMVLAYATVTMLPSSLPIYQENKTSWIKGIKPFKLPTDSLIYINPNSKNYQQIIPGQLAYFLKKYNLDGYYFDGTKPYPYLNNNQNYYPVLAYRELQKKIYDSIKNSNPQALIIGHMSQYMAIPVLSFVDAYVDGEQFRTALNGKQVYKVQDSYLDVMNLKQFRTEFIGKQWGIIPFFLPEFNPESLTNIQPTLGLASLLLVHDVQPWPILSNISVWNKMYKALDSFNLENSNFVPYYDANPPALTNNLEDVYVSAYIKQNQALVVVSNLSKINKSGKIILNNTILGLQKINSIFSLTDNAKVDVYQNTISINLSPLSYQLLWIK